VAALAEGCDAVFLDFDRTLATTKRGQSPYPQGASRRPSPPEAAPEAAFEAVAAAQALSPFAVDEDLASLAAWHPNVHVVTRNCHAADISAFLAEKGLGSGCVRRVWHVPRGQSKASVVLDPANHFASERLSQAAGGGGRAPRQATVLFVDDDVREHLCPRLVEANRAGRLAARLAAASSATSSAPSDGTGSANDRRAVAPLLHRVLFARAGLVE
jgi:hypothetical protein